MASLAMRAVPGRSSISPLNLDMLTCTNRPLPLQREGPPQRPSSTMMVAGGSAASGLVSDRPPGYPSSQMPAQEVPAFAHPVEKAFARVLDEHGIVWQYE